MKLAQSRRLAQEVADTYQRALTGGPFYAAAWLTVAFYGGTFARAPLASWVVTVVFVLLAAWRFVHRPPADGEDIAVLVRWLRLHWGIVLFTTAIWGALFAWAMLDPAFGIGQTTALLFTLGLATAIAHTFCMRRRFAFAAIALLCVPGLALTWVRPEDRASGMMMVIYLVYVVLALLRAYVEYQQRLDLDQELRNQRDLFSRLSQVDPLTELANRRQFADVLAAATVQAGRTDAPLTLLLFDIDHFKKVNDTHGHVVGDACLVAIGERLRGFFDAPGDLPARLGGEEFGVVMAGQELAQAAERAERFRALIAMQPVTINGLRLRVSASFGLAAFDPARHRDDDALYQAADAAVYRAKAAGRDQVCTEETVPA